MSFYVMSYLWTYAIYCWVGHGILVGMLYMMGALTNDGVKYKLKPLQEMNEKVCSATRVCVVDERKFFDSMRHEHMHFAIIPKY